MSPDGRTISGLYAPMLWPEPISLALLSNTAAVARYSAVWLIWLIFDFQEIARSSIKCVFNVPNLLRTIPSHSTMLELQLHCLLGSLAESIK